MENENMTHRRIALLSVMVLAAARLMACTSPAPTATPLPPAVTRVPPTATPILPTATLIPPTATPIPPTATATLPAATPEPSGSAPSALSITYTCNDGFIISASGKKVMVDALFQETYCGCQSSTEEAAALEAAQPPFDSVDLILVSHSHEDHFASQIVGTYLQNNTKAELIAMESVVSELQQQFAGFDQVQERVHSVQAGDGQSVQMTVQGIDLEVISAPADVPNLGFLIQIGGLTLFHTGDSGTGPETVALFQSYHLPDKHIDLAFVPWWYLADEWNHPLVEEGIQAQNYVPMHFAGDDAAQVFQAVAAYYPQAILFRKELQTWTWAPPQ
jgi:L-ascorbate metabolism protein UlaG (beta-lactamase superfamily)